MEKIIKIAFVGPESTGKTILAKALSEKYNTTWVAEYARSYLQKKWDEKQSICEPSDLLPIVYGQIDAEQKAEQKAKKILFCDTAVIQTYIYAQLYYGEVPLELSKIVDQQLYDLCFLTDIDVPWEKDDLRDRPNDRAFTYDFFEQQLIKMRIPYIKISGTVVQRMAQVTRNIDEL